MNTVLHDLKAWPEAHLMTPSPHDCTIIPLNIWWGFHYQPAYRKICKQYGASVVEAK
jgi:hypothetical protein